MGGFILAPGNSVEHYESGQATVWPQSEKYPLAQQ